MNRFIFTALVAATLFSAGCKKEEESNAPFLGYSYFPLEEGSVRIYQVDSIGWLGFTFDEPSMTVQIDTVHYELKEVVDGFYSDNEGRHTARIVRYRRTDENEPWVIYKVYSANLTPTKAERYEDNIRYVKLVFPPGENVKWTGQYADGFNANDSLYEPWEYEYESVNVPFVFNTFTFDSTLTVVQKNDINLIEYQYFREQYATGIGMFYKEYSHFEYPSTSSSFIKNGFIYKETLTFIQ